MVVNLLPLFLTEGDIKQINADSTILEKDVRFAENVEHLRAIN